MLSLIDVLFLKAARVDTTCYYRDYTRRTNCSDALMLFEDALRHGVGRIVYASNAAVYGAYSSPTR